MISIYIVEDHALLRQALEKLLRLAPDVVIVGMAPSGEEALVGLRSLRPNVLILDLKLPGMGGIELMRRLRFEGHLPPTLVLTTFEDERLLAQSAAAGAKGYLLKDVSLDELMFAIRQVSANRYHINPAVTDCLLRNNGSIEEDSSYYRTGLTRLTLRELDVLRLVANGSTNREIGDLLEIAEGTVKNHVSVILEKLGVRDRTRAVLQAMKSGVFHPPRVVTPDRGS